MTKVLEWSRDHVELQRSPPAQRSLRVLSLVPSRHVPSSRRSHLNDGSPTRSMRRPAPLSTSLTCAEPSVRPCSQSSLSAVYQLGRRTRRPPRPGEFASPSFPGILLTRLASSVHFLTALRRSSRRLSVHLPRSSASLPTGLSAYLVSLADHCPYVCPSISQIYVYLLRHSL